MAATVRRAAAIGGDVTLPCKLVPSLERIRRSIEAESAYTLSRLQVLQRIPGNPIGVSFRWVDDNVIAMMARHLPSPSFNSVVGLAAGHERHIAPLVAWYRDHDVEARFELVPGNYDSGLGRELARLGYYQSGFHASLIAAPDLDLPEKSDVAIEPVGNAALMEAYLDAYVAGWAVPETHRVEFKANVRPWLHEPGWSLYLARVDGRPAGAATLYMHRGIGYLADATTDPVFRRRGLHGKYPPAEPGALGFGPLKAAVRGH